MRYSLVIFKNNLDDEFIEITGYSELPGFEHLQEQSLKGVVDFTNMFEDEKDLICFLYDIGMLPVDYENGIPYIAYYRKAKSDPKILPHGVSYKSEQKFFDFHFLKRYFIEHMDIPEFIEPIIQWYCTYLKNNPRLFSHLCHIRFCYEFYLQNGYHFEEQFGSEERNRQTSMSNFVSNYCQSRNKKEQLVTSFSKVRELAMYAINFERLRNQVPENDQPTTPSQNDLTEEQIRSQIRHYQRLLNDEDYSHGNAQSTYEDKIRTLESQLEDLKYTRRRMKHEVTGN